jgi:hypothetical protein
VDGRPVRARSTAVRLVLGVAVTLASRPALGDGALDTLAKGVESLGPFVGPGVVVAAPVASDEPGSADELGVHLAALIARRLGAHLTAHRPSLALASARAAARDAKTMIFVRSSIVLGDVRMTAEVYSAAANVWDRVRSPSSGPTRQTTATAKIDAQVRAFLTPLALERASVQRFRLDDEDVLAEACGDTDGDGRDELLLVLRRGVVLGHLQEGAFARQRTVLWSDLAARTAVPLREPLGSGVVREGTMFVGSTDYGGVALSPDLSRKERLTGIPVWDGRGLSCLVAQPSAGAFDGAPIDCAPSRDPKPTAAVPAPRFDAFAAIDVVDSTGNTRTLVAVREPSGRVKVKLGDEASGLQGPFGAQIAVGDLDQDGSPEIVTTAGDHGDAIDLQTIATGRAVPQNRLHLPTAEPVRALAVCPPGEHGAPALAAVVGREVWLVRPELATAAKGSP